MCTYLSSLHHQRFSPLPLSPYPPPKGVDSYGRGGEGVREGVGRGGGGRGAEYGLGVEVWGRG